MLPTPVARTTSLADAAVAVHPAEGQETETGAPHLCPATDAPPPTEEQGTPPNGSPRHAAPESQLAKWRQGEGVGGRLERSSSSQSSPWSAVIFAGYHSGAFARRVWPAAWLAGDEG